MRPTCLSDTHSQEGRWEHLVRAHTCQGVWVSTAAPLSRVVGVD